MESKQELKVFYKMKRILLVLLSVLLLVCGCSRQDDGKKFAEEYGVSEDTKVKYMKAKDYEHQMTHGTHVVLICNEKDKDTVTALANVISEYDGMYIYYINSEEFAKSNQTIDIDETKDVARALFFIKEGEIIDRFDLDHVPEARIIEKVFSGLLDNMVREIEPGCSDGC